MKVVKLFPNLTALALFIYPHQHRYLNEKPSPKCSSLSENGFLCSDSTLQEALKLYIPIRTHTVLITVWFVQRIKYKELFYFHLEKAFLGRKFCDSYTCLFCSKYHLSQCRTSPSNLNRFHMKTCSSLNSGQNSFTALP